MSKSLPRPAALTLCAIAAVSPAYAAERTELNDKVVTATRTAQTAQQSLAAVTVFDRAQIEQSQATSVPELLKKVPGVSLANNGGPGKNTALFMRGTNSNHVLVLVDGIKVGSVTSGGAALQDLPLELIERIEVVRGPRSSLYGSEAIGGVIQIFTRKGAGRGAKPFFSAGYGTHDSYSGSAGVSGGDGKGWYSLDLRGEYRLSPEWRLQSRIANLLDADYQTAEGLARPGGLPDGALSGALVALQSCGGAHGAPWSFNLEMNG